MNSIEMPHYAVRVTHSFLQARPIVHEWAMRADKVLVYEHSKDTNTARDKTHIHMLLVNTSIDKKQLRNIAGATGVPVKGNEHMSFKMAEEPFGTYITYMTKGVLDASYNKGFTPEELAQYKHDWITPHEYVKETPWSKLYDAYAPEAPKPPTPEQYASVIRQWVEDPNPNAVIPNAQDVYIRELESHTTRWVIKRHNGYWNPAMAKQVNCLRFTHCWKHGLTIPKNKDGTFRWKL